MKENNPSNSSHAASWLGFLTVNFRNHLWPNQAKRECTRGDWVAHRIAGKPEGPGAENKLELREALQAKAQPRSHLRVV